MLGQARDLVGALLVLAVLGGPGALAAHAHSLHAHDAPAAAQRLQAAAALAPESSPPAMTLAPAAALLTAVLLGAGIVRHGLATTARVLLALLLVTAAAEGALHSVHHLDDPQGSADCQVLILTQQVHGEMAPEPPSLAPAAVFRVHATLAAADQTAKPVPRPDEGRAPPHPSA
jgi:hypothetical protein